MRHSRPLRPARSAAILGSRMRPKCDVCGAEGFDGQVYACEPLPFRKAKTYCPKCHTKFHERIVLVAFASSVVVGIVGLAFIIVNPQSETAHHFALLLLVMIFFCVSVLPHELGHAFAA